MPGLLDQFLNKRADTPALSYSMQGKLYASSSGWILLSVPNSLVRGVFDTLAEPGIELPPSGPSGDRLDAHISVIRKDELDSIGGPDKITERGHTYHYTLGPLRTVVPEGWSEMSKCWMLEVNSPELEKLRKGYGLAALPNNNKFKFHITCAVRRKHVLKPNEISKGAEASAVLQSPIKPSAIVRLQQAYEANQKNDYATKTNILRELMDEAPDDWVVDDPVGRNWGVTHGPTNFRFHMPPASIPESVRGPAVKRAWEEVVKETEDHELLKEAEDTPGIRDRSDYGDLMKLRTGQIYTLLSQMHEARKAGPHHDLRIGDKDTGLFSWASRKGLPQPGQKHLAIEQPIHSWDYKDFEGDIESGYGAGKVKKEFERPIAITSIDQNKISFSTADGKHPERFNLVKTPQGWLMVNSTPTEPTPYQKLHYHKIPAGEVESILQNFEPGTSFQAKIDGASSLVNLMQHGVDLLSYRSSRQTGRPIIHTERVFGGIRPKLDIPPELAGSVLKGELYGTRDGRAIPPSELGGILNAGIANSLDKQKNQNVKLRNALFDIQQYDGKPLDFHKVPYSERRKMLQEILQHLPQDVFHLSPEATTPEEARAMWKQIQEGSLPISSEGVVIHPPHGKPIKSKLTEDYDVWINNIFPGAGKYQDNAAGGFEYSLEPQGSTVGRVGTGFSDDLRKQMWENPNDWVGRVARIRSQQQLPSGAFRAPAFLSLHEDITGEPAEKMAEVGKHHGTPDSAYNQQELTKGVDVEQEHTDRKDEAKEIAKDHLSEFKGYYEALDKMEESLKAKQANMPIYQRAFNAQLYRPIWNSEQGALYNLADNLKGWHAKGQQMVQEQANTEAFEDSMNPQQGWERLRRRLGGQESIGPENPWDRALFT